MSHHFAGVCVRVAQRHVTVEVHLVVVTNELEDGDVEAAGERDAVLRHADGVVLGVRAPTGRRALEVAGCFTESKHYCAKVLNHPQLL